MTLMYVAKRCRPDVIYTVSQLATHCMNPDKTHFRQALDVLQHLHETKHHGLRFDKIRTSNLVVYSDASFCSHPDGKSHTGILCFYGGGVVAAISKKQSSVSKSTTTAELFSCSDAVDLALWIYDILRTIGAAVSTPIPLFEDNQSAIALIKGGNIGKEHRATRAKLHYLREKSEEGLIQLIHVRTELMLADLLTKVVVPKSLNQSLTDAIVHDCSQVQLADPVTQG